MPPSPPMSDAPPQPLPMNPRPAQPSPKTSGQAMQEANMLGLQEMKNAPSPGGGTEDLNDQAMGMGAKMGGFDWLGLGKTAGRPLRQSTITADAGRRRHAYGWNAHGRLRPFFFSLSLWHSSLVANAPPNPAAQRPNHQRDWPRRQACSKQWPRCLWQAVAVWSGWIERWMTFWPMSSVQMGTLERFRRLERRLRRAVDRGLAHRRCRATDRGKGSVSHRARCRAGINRR
jgi:YD repeat-containing protein